MADTPKWFDYEFYMSAKLAQLQAAEPANDWTVAKLVDAFAQNGFMGEEGAYVHFVQYGAAEEVAPNADFNASEYYAAKAAQFYGVEPSAVTELQIANVKALINEAGMNAWTHYVQYGSNEGVNPSNAFDADAYLAAKAAAMGGDWTAESVAKAISDAGMTVLEHYLTYGGKGEGEVAEGATFPVADDQKVPSNNPGETFTLTAGRDVFTGGDGDDVFNANLLLNPSSGAVTTPSFNVTDELDGGAGNDTLNVELTGALTQNNLGSVKNVENVNFTIDDSATADLSSWTGLENLTVNQLGTGAAQNWTVLGAKSVSVKGGAAVTVTDSGAAGADTLVTVAAENATGLVTVASDALTTLNLTGVQGGATVTAAAGERALTVNMNNATGTITDATATTLNVNATGAASTGVTLAAAAATSVNINADEALTLTAVNVAAATELTIAGDSLVTVSALGVGALETINAADSTGGVVITPALGANVAFTGSSAADTITLGASTKATDMGAGDDDVTLSAALAAGASLRMGEGDDTVTVNVVQTLTTAGAIDGGAGDNDKLVFTNTSYVTSAALGAAFTGFEVLEVSAAADKEFDTSLIAGIRNYAVGTSTGSVTLNKILNNATTTVSGSVANEKSLTVSLNVDTQNDTHTVVFDNGADAAAAGVGIGGTTSGGLGVSLVEHLNFVSAGNTNSANTIASLTADRYLTDITITGDQDFTISGLANAVSTELTINGSAATGKLTINASVAGSTAAININGGSAADTITGGVHGGVINGGAGADTITLAAAGATDILLYTQASDSTSTAMDSVANFQHGEDKINVAAFNLANQAVSVSSTAVDTTAADFFASAGVIFDAANNVAYIDANNDGVFSADGDLAIKLDGVNTIDANDFIFA